MLEKFEQAKAKLMLDYPYFGSIASALVFSQNDDLEAFASDGKHFEYNKEYLSTLDINEMGFALANASMHYALSHESRTGTRQGWLWQLATDYAINAMLVNNHFVQPERINYNPRFSGMYAEEIYAILESEIDDKDYIEEKEEEFRQKTSLNETEKDHNIDEDFLNQLHKKMKNQGELPKDIDIFFKHTNTPTPDWRNLLARFVDHHAKEDYQFLPPNKKYLHQGLILPAISSQSLKITLAIDTSASINVPLLEVFFAELSAIMDSFNHYEIERIECDTKIQNHQTFLPGEPLHAKVKGGGGTDFRPVFEYVNAYLANTQLLIYFTDGEGNYPLNEPSYDTLWVMPQEKEVPFGERLLIQTDV